MKQIPEKYNSYPGGMTHAEIAKEENISTSMSHRIEYEAMIKLCKGLIGEGCPMNDAFVEKFGRQPVRQDYIDVSKSVWFRDAIFDMLRGK